MSWYPDSERAIACPVKCEDEVDLRVGNIRGRLLHVHPDRAVSHLDMLRASGAAWVRTHGDVGAAKSEVVFLISR